MSKIVAANVISGAHKVYEKARKKYEKAVKRYGKKQEISFPNTGYYLPVIYGILGYPVKKPRRCRSGFGPLRTAYSAPSQGKDSSPVLGTGSGRGNGQSVQL